MLAKLIVYEASEPGATVIDEGLAVIVKSGAAPEAMNGIARDTRKATANLVEGRRRPDKTAKPPNLTSLK
jgi:hypothetical protein